MASEDVCDLIMATLGDDSGVFATFDDTSMEFMDDECVVKFIDRNDDGPCAVLALP